jgi:hypothetical protein
LANRPVRWRLEAKNLQETEMPAHLALKSKGMAVALALILSSTGSTWAAPGTEGSSTTAASTTSASQPAVGTAEPAKAESAAKGNSAADPNSTVVLELKELEAAVAAQTKEFDEHSKQLEAERAALHDELARVAGLEAKLGVTPGVPASADSFGATATIQPSLQQDSQNQSATKSSNSESPLSFKIGGAEFTPGGYVDLIGTFRSVNIGSGLTTNLPSIPFNNTLPAGRLSEFRFNPTGSRVSLKVDANINKTTAVTAYLETDFAGYQPPNTDTTTNPSSLRLRHYWVQVRNGRWELLTGQSWSLLTATTTGLSPLSNDVFTANRLDTSYVAGIVFARQPGIRVTYHATPWWTLGVSLENPQQFVPSSVVFPGASGYFAGQFDNGSGSTSGSGATTNTTTPNLHPDIIAKTAFDWKIGGHAFHAEVGGIARSFRVFNNLVTPGTTNTITGGGGVANINFELFRGFHLITDTAYGDGIGRYIGALGPDVIVKANGELSGVHAESGVGGFQWQLTPTLLVDAYYGGAYFNRNYSIVSTTSTVGFGFPGSANTNNRSYQQGTVGFTSTLWSSPSRGRVQFIAQPAYVVRTPWSVAPGNPKNAHVFITYVDLRYVLP